MKIIPLLDKIVVKEIKKEQSKTQSGILLPSSSNEKPCIAKVVAVREGGTVDGVEIKMLVKKNDTILYNKFAATDVKIDDENYIIVKQDDALAIIE